MAWVQIPLFVDVFDLQPSNLVLEQHLQSPEITVASNVVALSTRGQLFFDWRIVQETYLVVLLSVLIDEKVSLEVHT